MVDASRSPSSFLALFPRLSARSPFPHSLARKGIRADPVQRLLLLARFQKVVQGFGAKRWINEQLSRPPLLNLTAENDVDFWRFHRTGFGKEEVPGHLPTATDCRMCVGL